jgi:ornithine carbamoyltransferase
MRHFLRITDMPLFEAGQVLLRAKEIKDAKYRSDLLKGKTALMVFEKASTRTRLSFEMAVRHLGGSTIFMTPNESQLGRSEPLTDSAQVFGRYVDLLIVRTFEQAKLETLKNYSGLPVVNALSDSHHPCQVMGDMLTIYERTPDLENVHVAWIGDGNNMANSWIDACSYFPFYLTMAFPKGYEPDTAVISRALANGAKLNMTYDPAEAIEGAHYVNTDVWASMGQEEEQKKREKAFKDFHVDEKLMALAAPGAKFMHCLPAHRGEEVSAEVMDGENSIIFDQAENRMHMQMAILEWVMQGIEVDYPSMEKLAMNVPKVPPIHAPF